jgi:hypothetical protein
VRSRASAALCLLTIALAFAVAGCSKKPVIQPLILDGNLLTVNNTSSNEWTGVDLWLNRNHRVVVKSIPAGGRLQVPLDAFVAGFGQRFDRRRTQITDVRLTAKLPDGSPLELTMPFEEGGLAGAFGGKR